jgi:hypothetical protein
VLQAGTQAHGVDHPVEPPGVGLLARQIERQGDVLLGRQHRQQIEGLEHEADAVAPQAG